MLRRFRRLLCGTRGNTGNEPSASGKWSGNGRNGNERPRSEKTGRGPRARERGERTGERRSAAKRPRRSGPSRQAGRGKPPCQWKVFRLSPPTTAAHRAESGLSLNRHKAAFIHRCRLIFPYRRRIPAPNSGGDQPRPRKIFRPHHPRRLSPLLASDSSRIRRRHINVETWSSPTHRPSRLQTTFSKKHTSPPPKPRPRWRPLLHRPLRLQLQKLSRSP